MARITPNRGFETEAKCLFPHSKVVYFKIASGGKPIRLWVKQWNTISAHHG